MLLAVTVASCGTVPLDTFDLTASRPAVAAKSRKNLQILIQAPAALKALDGQNIVVNTSPDEIEYLKGAQWGDRLPSIVQSRLVQAFDNTGLLGGVGRPGDGLAIDYQVITDIRTFGVDAFTSNPTATVEIGAKIMNDKNGEVRATRVFTASVPVRGSGNAAYVQALNAAFDQVTGEIVSWTLSVI
ncbi:cholesterol transport system auxiliary component [Phyllobacterium leguminum]|uniref:Cholesterol transport system auxiliary component n=2 Tax=Phyllobacterium leguminum TaxID=314237 RepID=A0A318T8U3_9HYPH|nr:cholesterol transport system auxiliary component [Phyllobacterium leguminum]